MTSSVDPFTGLTAFITAAEWRSFSVAASKLGLTPSAVSKSVSRLEASLGVKLFHRSPRAVTLTPAGQTYFDQCHVLFQQASDARASVSGRPESVQGKLRVCLPVSFGLQRLSKNLPRWQQSHPDTHLEIVLSDRNVDLVQERFDLAVRFHDVPDSRLIARPLKRPRFLTAASPDYLASHGIPQAPRDLAQHNCLAYLDSHTGLPRPWSFQGGPRGLSHQPLGNLVCDQGAFLLNCALAGGGIIHGPDHLLAPSLDAGELVTVLDRFDGIGPPWWLVYQASRFPSARLRSFIDFVEALDQAI